MPGTTPAGTRQRQVVLVLGGARSGKSAYAARIAQQLGEPIVFLATAAAGDADMTARISAHRAARPASWRTIEATTNVGQALREGAGGGIRTVLLDCLTLLVSNHLGAAFADDRGEEAAAEEASVTEARVRAELDQLLEAVRAADTNLVVVSNEVGMGIVPPFPLGRAYRDALGRANQQLAAAADAVYLMVAGIPVDVKRLSALPLLGKGRPS